MTSSGQAEAVELPQSKRGFAEEIVQSISQHEWILLVLVLSLLVLIDVGKAYSEPLWFDEFFTLFLSRLSTFADLVKAMPADGQPPLQYLLTHLALSCLGESQLALRLPELLAYTFVGLLTYRIVRFHGTMAQGLFALTMVMGGVIGCQAYTARPYGLLMAFTALAFVSWQRAGLAQKRLLYLCGIAVGLGGAILSHHFGVIYVCLFLAVGEAVRLIERQRIDGGVLFATVVGLAPLSISLRLAHQSHLVLGEAVQHSTNYFYKPKLSDLMIYIQMFPVYLLVLVLVIASLFFLVALRVGGGRIQAGSERAESIPAHEWAAASALSLLLPMLLLISSFATGVFAARYAVGASLGLAILSGWGLPRVGWLRKSGQAVLFTSTICFLLLRGGNFFATQLHEPFWRAKPAADAGSALLWNAPPDLPIVVANSVDFPTQWWYSPLAAKNRLVYVYDLEYAERQPEFLTDISLVFDKAYTPLPLSNYADFVHKNHRFLLLCTGNSRRDWIKPRLMASGWNLEPIAQLGQDALYQVSSNL